MFKPAGKVIVAICEDGFISEADNMSKEYPTIAAWVRDLPVEIHQLRRIIILDPTKDKPRDGAQTVEDVTGKVAGWWLASTDILDWDLTEECPAFLTDDEWENALDEARAETDDDGKPLYRSDDWWDDFAQDMRDKRAEAELDA